MHAHRGNCLTSPNLAKSHLTSPHLTLLKAYESPGDVYEYAIHLAKRRANGTDTYTYRVTGVTFTGNVTGADKFDLNSVPHLANYSHIGRSFAMVPLPGDQP